MDHLGVIEGSPEIHRGTLYLYFGPMYSGKTSRLNMDLTHMADTGFHCLKVVHMDDQRTDVVSNTDAGSTHNSTFTSLSKKIDVVRATHLAAVDVQTYHAVGVDEAHFYPDLLDCIKDWLSWGKHVRVAGLDGDFKMAKFGQILDLIPLSDRAEKMAATCEFCLDELKAKHYKGNILAITGSFTRKIAGDMGVQKDVGGSDKYVPVCRYHHEWTE
jgi:thymidine kinase